MPNQLRTSLANLRVLDASRVLAGPFCTQVLADLGADVIKVEDPKAGDETRGWGPPFQGDFSAYFLSCNRGKRSLALDLSVPAGRDTFLALAAKSDVVVENFKRSSAARLKLTAKDLHAVNPRLIICSVSGFGTGPRGSALPGYDFVVQGLSGMMAMTGPAEGVPHKVGVAIADIVTGLYAGIAALAALHARQTSGHGYTIDVALLDCAVAAMANVAQAYLTSGRPPQRQGNAHLQIVPYQMFEAQDGWLILAVGNDGQWRKFCTVAGAKALGEDPRYAHNADRVAKREELVPKVATIIRSKTVAAWQKLLDGVGVPNGPVWDFVQLFHSDLARERGLKVSVRRPDGTPVDLIKSPLVSDLSTALAPPALGEHTADLLKEILGLGDADIARLKKDGAFA